MSPSEAWRLLSAEDDQSVTTLSEAYLREVAKSTEARSQSSSQYDDANVVSTPLLRETQWEETSRNVSVADSEQETTGSIQGNTETFVEQEQMSPPSSYLSEAQTDVIRPDPFAAPEECYSPDEVSPTSYRTVVKQPPNETVESSQPMRGSDVTSESCGCPSETSTASKHHASCKQPLALRDTQSPVHRDKSVILKLDALLKLCAMEIKALRHRERIAAELSQDQTQGRLLALPGTNTMPESHRSLDRRLLNSEIPMPELQSDQTEAIKPAAFLRTPSADIQSPIDSEIPMPELPSDQTEDIKPSAFLRTPSADIQPPVPEPVAVLKRCSMKSKVLHPSEKVMAKPPPCQTRSSLYPLRDTDVEQQCCDSPGKGQQTPKRPVPKLPSYQAEDSNPPAPLGTLSPSRQLLIDRINSMRPVPVSLLKRYAVPLESLRGSERTAAGPSRDRGPVPELPLDHGAHNEPPEFQRTRPASLQLPVKQINSVSPDPIALLKRCAKEAKALHPSRRIVAETPSDQILDSSHPAKDPAAKMESCGCQVSEMSLAEMPLDGYSDNSPPSFVNNRPEASKSGSVLSYECLDEQRDVSAPLEAPMEAYLYTNVWSSDAGTQSGKPEDLQAYKEIELPPSSELPFPPGSKLVQIGSNYWLVQCFNYVTYS